MEAKSRLSSMLSPMQRRELALAMTMDVLDSLRGMDTVLVCREDVRNELHGYEFSFLLQKNPGLENAVEAANYYAIQQGAQATLFLPADVPRVKPEIIKEILVLGKKNSFIISPGRRRGIGMLYRRPPDLVKAVFTEKSFDDNLELASRNTINAFIYNNPELYSDIDTPEDLREFLRAGRGTRSHDYLAGLGKIF